ncbi:DUF4232 domain-containing protein [Jatrophihabitans sp.]|jgi:hypothetical protein|uniref:DUF4232 domain-containing protein n=1 Tax=Jatrophihabitans sp. TaxID=1932789 RepID=UPI002EE1E4D4
MSPKTLTDELRSVLLFHSLEAPQPNATVDRILNDTVGSVTTLGGAAPTAAGTARPARRVSVLQLVAASVVAVLLLTVAGINSARNRNTDRSASTAGKNQFDQPASASDAAGSVVVPDASARSGAYAPAGGQPAYVGRLLDCSKIPGGQLITGQSDDFTLSAGQHGYLYEFLCVGKNGQRSASEVQAFLQVGTTLVYLRTLLAPAAGQHLDFVIGGMQSTRIQVSDHTPAAGGVPGGVVAMAFDISDDRWNFSTAIVAEPCLRKDLRATVSAVPDAPAPSWMLALRNDSKVACALEGYPQVRARLAGATLTTAVQTMNGPAGGVRKKLVPPIIVLSPGATASAIVEQRAASAAGSCRRSDQLAVTLPNGVPLGLVPAELAGCGLTVHPLVGNARGSD